MIIKPLEEEYEIIELRTTSLEGSLHPLDPMIMEALMKQTPNRRNTTSYLGNLFEESVMSSIIDPLCWALMCDLNAERIRTLWWLEDGSKKDVEFLLYKLDNLSPVEIAKEYYEWRVMSCQNSLKKL